MKTYWAIALKLTFVTLMLLGVLYPLFITGLAKLIGPNHGAGEEIVIDGVVRGFTLIGQHFDADGYFNSRPSAVAYDAASAGGSNLAPTSPGYLAQVQQRIDTILARNPTIRKEAIPVDLVTASGSGLDPHISPQAARIQIDRIAQHRKMSKATLEALVNQHITPPFLGLMGTPTVHVLRLNRALDELHGRTTHTR